MNKDKLYYKINRESTHTTLYSGNMTNFGGMAWNYVTEVIGNSEKSLVELEKIATDMGWEKYEEGL